MTNRTEWIANYYGYDNQRLKSIEELSELIQALIKDDKAHIAEEIADVEIMLAQIKCFSGIPAECIESIKDMKLDRQMMRIRNSDGCGQCVLRTEDGQCASDDCIYDSYTGGNGNFG